MKYNTLRNAKGDRIGAYQFVYDVTERLREQERLARAEETLRQGQKMEAMGQLTGGVAHDFNNLLTPIVGALDALQRRGTGGEREQRLIAGAMQSAERAKTLVQRLLAFARRQPLQVRPADVGELVRGMGELIASTSGPQIKVSIDIEQELPAAKVDENQLEMALLNLAVNARDAMPSGGTLRITADAQAVNPGYRANLNAGRYVRISVGTALLVDDEDLVRATAADMLTELGYAVLEAASAEEAIRLIGDGLKPQLLITDHLMTGMNGADLARLVRSELPGTQVLLVSGYAESEGIAADLPRMVKPFNSNELAAKLASLSSGE
ncbi:response regulator [Bradyrhizobium jicamae]|nr:response regulator [Bradyrhizobium jicamae]